MSAAVANQSRRLLDQSLVKSIALPAAAAANNTASVNLGSKTLGPVADFVELEIFIGATAALVDTKTITLTVKDSADDSSFAAVPSLATLVQTGAGGAGAAAATRRVRLPGSTRQFLRVDAAVESGGGSNVAVSYGFRVLANQ
jgi:hypothetical protein